LQTIVILKGLKIELQDQTLLDYKESAD